MTDETTTVPAAIVCPVEDCHALIPDTIEDQRAHRRGHTHRDKVDEAIRTALKIIRGRMDTLEGSTKDDVKAMQKLVGGVERLVKQIEIPEQLPQMQISRAGWDEQPDEDEPADDVDDEWGDLTRPIEPEPSTGSVPVADSTGYDDEPDADRVIDDLRFSDQTPRAIP